MAPNNTSVIDQTLERVVSSLRSGNTVIVCGAGISRWSGLPMAMDVLKHVLAELGTSKDSGELIGPDKLPLPFETYLETLLGDGIDFVSDVFSAGQPNRNHILFAKLMKMGYLKTIVTTNFDKLIERALEAEGLGAGSGYDLLYRESDFTHIDWAKPKCRVIKIHGSVEDPKTLAATISAIAAQEPNASRRSVVEEVFSTGSHSDVLILGYSCSDIFDITPQIESLGPSTKFIVLNEYSRNAYIESISKKENHNAFRQFPNGWRWRYDTDHLVELLWKELVGSDPPRNEPVKTHWEEIVSTSLRRSPNLSTLRHSYPAELLYQMGDYESSRMRLLKAMKEAENTKDAVEILRIQAFMAEVCLRLGDYEASRTWCEHVLQKMPKALLETILGFHTYMVLGETIEAQGDINIAVKCFRNALMNAENRGDPHGVTLATHKYGVTLAHMGNFRDAMQLFSSTLEKGRRNGQKQLEGVCLGGIGNILKDSGMHLQAIFHLEEALEIAQKLGDRRHEGIWLGNIGSVYQNRGSHQQALEHYKEALIIAVTLGDKENEAGWLSNMGISYKETGRYTEAFACYERAIAIDRLLGNKRGLGADLNNLGNLYRLTGEREKARKCYLEAIEVAVETGDQYAAARRRHNLQIVERE